MSGSSSYMLKYMREYRRKHRKQINAAARKYARKHRATIARENQRRHRAKRRRTIAHFKRVCGFYGCRITQKLKVHHDHDLQKQLGCCKSVNGCKKCQVCLLCWKHNVLLGMVCHSTREAQKVVRFLKRFHGRYRTLARRPRSKH
jgi:hypothetical protein